jgi:hypothetical protein
VRPFAPDPRPLIEPGAPAARPEDLPAGDEPRDRGNAAIPR